MYELALDTYTVRVLRVSDKWGVQIFDHETGSDLAFGPDNDSTHYEDSLEAAQLWGCRELGLNAISAIDAGVSDPCSHFGLMWQEVDAPQP